jgi:hypothetical protein
MSHRQPARIACLLALLAATPRARADATPPTPKPPADQVRQRPAIPEPLRPILTEKPRGVIVREHDGGDFYLFDRPKADAFFTPSRDDVAAMEKKLPELLARQAQAARRGLLDRFPGYTRQYVGIVAGKQRLLWVNFFCRDMGVAWTREPVLVKDGGDCFGQLLFAPATGKLLTFNLNGEG